MQAIITAGGTFAADNPLFLETGIAKKALLPMGGTPMIRWVADALMASKHIENLIIVGMEAGEFDDTGLTVRYTPARGGIIDNVLAGADAAAEIEPDFKKLVLASSDIPLITPQIIDEFVDICLQTDDDLYYPVVEQKTMEARFPGSNRTFTPLKGGKYTGGDLFVLDRRAVEMDLDLMRSLSGERKDYWAQARLLGFGFIFRFIFRLMDLAEAERRACKILNLRGNVLDYPRPEVAMDVDKLHQYKMVKQILEASPA